MGFMTAYMLTLNDVSGVELRQKSPATDLSQQGIKLGSGQQQVTLDSVIVQMYFTEKVLKFPEQLVSLHDVVHQTFVCRVLQSRHKAAVTVESALTQILKQDDNCTRNE